jgi:excisionase family DNA binding protein
LTPIDSITDEPDMRHTPDGRREARESEAGCLTGHDVAAILRVSTRTVHRMVAARQMPAPVRIGKSAVRWRRRDILAFLDSLKPR